MPLNEVRKPYKERFISDEENVGFIFQQLGTHTEAVGPGNLDNPVLKHFQFGNCTNDWAVLVRRTAFLFLWYSTVFGMKGMHCVNV